MTSFQLKIYSKQDIPASLREGLKECGSLKVHRRTWARIVEALGVDVHFSYYDRRDEEEQPSLEDAGKAVINEGLDIVFDEDEVKMKVCENILEYVTPNGVSVNLTNDGRTTLIVAVHFNRDSAFLATMMLAGFARRVPAAYPLLAEAARELADGLK